MGGYEELIMKSQEANCSCSGITFVTRKKKNKPIKIRYNIITAFQHVEWYLCQQIMDKTRISTKFSEYNPHRIEKYFTRHGYFR